MSADTLPPVAAATDTGVRQDDINERNASFWNDLCGSQLAQVLGVTDRTPTSLRRFDRWFFDFYPYLLDYVPVRSFLGKRVIEIGLGYGSVGQKIAEAGADYLGMDIAAGPVGMIKHRLQQDGLPGDAIQRNFLENKLPSESFDALVAIGCFHHTGDLQGCFDETYRLLKPGGTAHMMVYNRYSLRRWNQNRAAFIKEILLEPFGLLRTRSATEQERAASDTNTEGEAAPETIYVSQFEVKRMLRHFSSVKTELENMDISELSPERDRLLATWGKRMGLDLYIVARK